jgi:hypothetical protein
MELFIYLEDIFQTFENPLALLVVPRHKFNSLRLDRLYFEFGKLPVFSSPDLGKNVPFSLHKKAYSTPERFK